MTRTLICVAFGALLLFSIPAGAETAASVLAAARQASGGDAWNATANLTLAGTERYSGNEGVYRETLDLRTGRFRHDDSIGIVHYADVWDGHTRWKQDLSGGVHALDSAFLRSVSATDAWLTRRDYLKPDGAGAALTASERKRDAGIDYDVIAATPSGGQTIQLWFDARTHRLARTIRAMAIYDETVNYGGYRAERGLMLPHKIVVDDGDLASDETFLLRSCEIASAADDVFARPKAPDDWTIAGGSTVVPIEFDGDVVVEAKINGQGPFGFILDTGGHDILTPAAAKALGLKPVGAGVSGGAGEGTLSEQYARVASLQIGGASLRDQVFTILPLPFDAVERGPRPPLAGILGLELFERFAMRLDYRGKTLSFTPFAGYRHQGGGTAVPISFSDDIPLLDATLDGHPGSFALDTGNSGTLVVQARWADKNGLTERMKSGLEMISLGAGGQSRNWASRVDLDIAGTPLPHVVGRYANDRKGSFASRTEAGNIGNDVLAHFTLDFDYGGGRIWFEPTPGWTPQPFSRAGFSLSKQESGLFHVIDVTAGTPAADAGLRTGDDVIAIDGVPSAKLSGWDFRRAVRRTPGTKVTLSILRGGKPRQIVIALRELLP